MRLPRPLIAALTAAAMFWTLGGTADAAAGHAKPIKPKLGVWEAAPKGVDSYGVGGWTLSRVNGHLHMTAHPDWGGIYYPNADKCGGALSPGLSKPDYRISDKAKFHIKDKEAQQTISGKPLVQHVIWKGRYTHKKQVSGRISIWVTKPATKPGAKPKVVCRDMNRQWGGGTA
ncbi:MAG: hypothetical protein QM747_02920 [Nocardioides sp.]